MKFYKLNAIIDSNSKESKVFLDRDSANKYMIKLLDKYKLEVKEVVCKNNNHNIEFICNSYNRIFIDRKII